MRFLLAATTLLTLGCADNAEVSEQSDEPDHVVYERSIECLAILSASSVIIDETEVDGFDETALKEWLPSVSYYSSLAFYFGSKIGKDEAEMVGETDAITRAAIDQNDGQILGSALDNPEKLAACADAVPQRLLRR